MTTKERVYKLYLRHYTSSACMAEPLTLRQAARRLDLKAWSHVHQICGELVAEGLLVRNERGHYHPPLPPACPLCGNGRWMPSNRLQGVFFGL